MPVPDVLNLESLVKDVGQVTVEAPCPVLFSDESVLFLFL